MINIIIVYIHTCNYHINCKLAVTANEGDVCNLWSVMPERNQVEHASWADVHKRSRMRLVQANKEWIAQIDGDIPGEYLACVGVAR